MPCPYYIMESPPKRRRGLETAWGLVLTFARREELVPLALVSNSFLLGTGQLHPARSLIFNARGSFDGTGVSLVLGDRSIALADRSIALNRVEAARTRFPKVEDTTVYLRSVLRNDEGFTDARRSPILAKLSTFTFVTTLNLSRNDIASLPASIGDLTALKTLHLEDNKIVTLPDSIGRLTALKTLNLSYNDIVSLPASIGGLTALETLSVTTNVLTSLPESIGSLRSLTTLNVNDNRIPILPDTIGQLTDLKELDLSYNNLTTLPRSITNLSSVLYLDISCNELLNDSWMETWLKDLGVRGCYVTVRERLTRAMTFDPRAPVTFKRGKLIKR